MLGGADKVQRVANQAVADLGLALSNMVEALQILDNAGAPGHIGAHLDLAVEQLREYIAPEFDKPIPRIGLGSN